jgi:hypothetical protein
MDYGRLAHVADGETCDGLDRIVVVAELDEPRFGTAGPREDNMEVTREQVLAMAKTV